MKDPIESILEEFDELLSHYKRSEELPNTAVNRMRHKPNSVLEQEIKAFIGCSLQKLKTALRESLPKEVPDVTYVGDHEKFRRIGFNQCLSKVTEIFE